MYLREKIVKKYLAAVEDISTNNPQFMRYASTILKNNPTAIDKFSRVAKLRNCDQEQISTAINLMAIYNLKHFTKVSNPYIQHNNKKTNHPDISAIIIAGGSGSRMSLLGTDCPKPLIEVFDNGYFKSLISYTLDDINDIGCREVVICANGSTKKIKEHLINVPEEIKFVKKIAIDKRQALRESLKLVDKKSRLVIRTTADTYRPSYNLSSAIESHLSLKNPDEMISIIYREVDPRLTGLSTTIFQSSSNVFHSACRYHEMQPEEVINNNLIYGIKLGLIIGKKIVPLVYNNASYDMNLTYNKIEKINSGKINLIKVKDQSLGIDDPFDLSIVLKKNFRNEEFIPQLLEEILEEIK